MPISIPAKLIESLSGIKGFDKESFLEAHHSGIKPVSVRLNPTKRIDAFNHLTQVPWCKNAYYLSTKMDFIFDPFFHSGCYYVQEASSMFLDYVFRFLKLDGAPIKVLDLCASPGGKSTTIASNLHEKSVLVSNEVIKSRIGPLQENLTKWGNANVLVCNNDPKDFTKLPHYFDAIVVDAPCSGSGLFRKQPETVEDWSEEAVIHCSARQERILSDIENCLKPGGLLIYSTCSYSEKENEALIKSHMNKYSYDSVQLELASDWGIIETHLSDPNIWSYRFFPHLLGGEGFFLSCLRKSGTSEDYSQRKRITKPKDVSDIKPIKEHYLHDTDKLFFIKKGDNINFLTEETLDCFLELEEAGLNIRKTGTQFGLFKGKDFIPSHELALSNFVNPNVECIELSLEQSLAFLRKQEVQTEENLINGFYLVQHKKQCLGWVKVIGKRMNNYFPKEWRVLKQ